MGSEYAILTPNPEEMLIVYLATHVLTDPSLDSASSLLVPPKHHFYSTSLQLKQLWRPVIRSSYALKPFALS